MLKPVPNPAWQPAEAHARRLVAISHHFLSEPAVAPVAAESRELAVLLAEERHEGTAALPDSSYLLKALARQLNLPGSGAGTGWHVQTYAQPQDIARDTPTLVLIDPTLAAARNAYTAIKQLCADGCGPIGVLFRAGDDLAAARRCYRRLAVGVLRFLGQPLINLGWLPNRGPHFAAALAHAAQVIHSRQQHPAAPRDSAAAVQAITPPQPPEILQ